MGDRAPSWVDKVKQAAESDIRSQPWKKALGETHDKGADGEDLINLNLPNFVQCGSLAA
ncbi:hypothetical protein H2198_009928 [Neophaeococcomyces mojaviensis]|uniref:Uncharacterized protein n=1 Tax=Neophaeococcomyces mojaviensis TaxID=3383035 RepID=A0ACC2ZT46_9EURO|nr:hypothetical protein H2198_009928 [Knufia sp. JES_112]